jgi:formiminotetrahydrofolate cyclodeaminase
VTGLDELTVTRFTEALASSAPTPGGGSASALSGALAASLVAMVARNTAANPSFAAGARDMEEIAAEAAFDQVMTAFRLPKETTEQEAARSRAIQAGYQAAVEPPLLVCRHAVRVLALAGAVAEQGNPNAVSDAGVAALLAASALEGAALNVEINLVSIKDESYRTRAAETVHEARTNAAKLRDEALATVRATLD